MKGEEFRALFERVERLYLLEGTTPWVERLADGLCDLAHTEDAAVMLFGPPETSPGSPVGIPLGIAARGPATANLMMTAQALVISADRRDDTFRELLQRSFQGPPAITQAEFAPAEFMAHSAFGQALRAAGIADQAILATTNSGAPALLGICLERGPGGRSEVVVKQLAVLAPHASAAARLIQRKLLDRTLEPEARLRPDGHIVDATGPATQRESRDALRNAVCGAERARLRRVDPEEALQLRVALVSGRWTLIDEIDTDGARFWLALENEPRAPQAPARLTPRQRTVVHLLGRGLSDEEIAAELGIRVATVDVHIRAACARLEVQGRRGILAALARPETWASNDEA